MSSFTPYSADATSVLGPEDPDQKVHGTYNPSPEEQELLRKVTRMFDKSRNHRSKFDVHWAEYYKWFRGKQLLEKKPGYRSQEVINMIFQTIQSQVPMITDTKPKFEFSPENPQDIPLADILNQVLDYDWTRNNWLYELTEVVFDSHIFGTGTSRLWPDPAGDDGLGSIVYESTDPFYNFPAPHARNTNKKCNSYFWAEPTEVEDIRREYPTNGKYVNADMVNFENLDRTNIKDVRMISPSDNQIYVDSENASNKGHNSESVLISGIFMDYTKEEENPGSDPAHTDSVDAPSVDSNPSDPQTPKLKYPTKRFVQWANGVILRDEINPIEEGFIPAQRLCNYIDSRMFWGISEVEQLKSPQRTFNKILNSALDMIILMGNPIWIGDSTCGVDIDSLTNRPGLAVLKEPDTELRREQGVPIPPYILQLTDRLVEWFNQVSGSQDVSRGTNPTGVTAASAITELQQAAQTRIRQKSRNLDAYLQDVGQQYLSLVFQTYTIPRIVQITSKQDPAITHYFKFHVTSSRHPETGELNRLVNVRPFNRGEDGQHYLGDELVFPANSKFHVKVDTGSSLPFSKTERENRLFKLLELGVIDDVEVLKGLDYPNYEAVIARMEQKRMQQMQPPPPQAGAEGAGIESQQYPEPLPEQELQAEGEAIPY